MPELKIKDEESRQEICDAFGRLISEAEKACDEICELKTNQVSFRLAKIIDEVLKIREFSGEAGS